MNHLTYHLDFSRFNEHLVNVKLDFIAKTNSPTVWLPSWIAGSYLIREFSKNITNVKYSTDITHRADKLSKNTWQLSHVHAGETVSIQYEVYCYDLSVRTAFVDHLRLFGNFTSLLLMVTQCEQAMCQITLSVPNAFFDRNPNAILACGLPHDTHHDGDATLYQLRPIQAFESYDYPFEIASQDEFCFDVSCNHKTIAHRFFVSGIHFGDLDRLKTDVRKICQSYVTWLEDVPFGDYTFMLLATDNEYGGLEHINSTALVSPRSDLPSIHEPKQPTADYQRLLGLCSHEYFHAWWVKTVRPDVMMTSSLQAEAYTPLLWVFEGFTSYVDDFMLLQSGVINKDDYAKLLTAQINRYQATNGRHHQSVAESSFDAWIKLYRPDENSSNHSISYYNKGALVAWLLDVTLMTHSAGRYRLFDVIKAFYNKAKTTPNGRFGMTDENLSETISYFIAPSVWQEFYQKYIIGTDELPINETLTMLGVTYTKKNLDKPWGMQTNSTPAGLKITHIDTNSDASRAGLSAMDTIIAIDGIRATSSVLNAAIQRQKHQSTPICVWAFHQDRLCHFNVQARELDHQNEQITITAMPNGAWLDGFWA
ncbi:M61 family peptidase [Moraxella nasovis]|uniref:M61 family metallopeptidase n=1 Tax=Moraxella nasovis TaxID=2904121 RepID=UPI001F61A8D5|nr:M61 family peptidase [Moraxella nasovis]UNU73924.1 M61 family peptidase [Moraxella nasovis]